MKLEDLKNPEFQEKLKSAKTAEELAVLAKEEGVELTDEQLEVLSGGEEWYEPVCKGDYCLAVHHPPV